jgi:flagellar motor switch protein FliG
MDKTNPEVIGEIEQILDHRLSSVVNQEVSISGGVKQVAEILNSMDRNSERSVFQVIQENDSSMADEIRKLMFTFDDVILVDDRGIQRVLKEVEQKELALAMKAAGKEIAEKLFKNMSERAGALLKEEIEYLGPVKLRDVEAAQQKIVAVVRRLEEAGEIIVQGRGGGAEEIIV